MARLQGVNSDESWLLIESSTVGRDPQSWLVLAAPCASNAHAQILHRGGRWIVMDTSTNGTWIDGRRVSRAGRQLARGQRLRFGTAQGETFAVIDVEPPEPIAVDVADPRVRVEGEDGVLSLSGPDGAISIHATLDDWTIEGDGAPRGVTSAEHIVWGSTTWRLLLPGTQADTVKAPEATDPAASAVLLLRHSQGFDDLELGLRDAAGHVVALGPRTYATMLLVLAGARDVDLRDGVDAREAGWIAVPDLLDRMVRGTAKTADRQQLNTYRLRFTRALAKHGVTGPAAPRLERRLDSDRIRLAGPVCIEPL